MGGSVSVSSTADCKEKGDELFGQGQYYDAIFEYTAGINNEYALISNDIHNNDDDIHDNIYDDLEDINSQLRSKDILSKLFSNRSAAFLQCNHHVKALDDALSCIEISSTWYKGYYRASKALLALGRHNDAKEYIEKAVALLPDDENLMILYDEIIKSDNTTNTTASNSQDRRSLGQVYSWGVNTNGQLGHGHQKDKNFPTMIDHLKEKHIIDVGAGTMHSVCLVSSGELYVWGSNSYSQLGLGNHHTTECALYPVLQPKLIGTRIRAISVGAAHTVAITSDGRCYSWGINRQGQCGLGDSCVDNINEPTLIPEFGNEETMCVSCGIAHTFFLLRTGKLLSCGMNNYGQLGLGISDQSVWTPTVVSLNGITEIKHIACGGVHTLLIDNDNKVHACGSNSCSQLGMEDCRDINEFKLIISLITLQAAYVSCGEEFSCIITTKKSVYTCGLRILNGNLEPNSTPTLVKELEGLAIESLSCSQKLIMAVSSTGDVYSWGIVDDQPDIGIGIEKTGNIKKPEKLTNFGKHKRIRRLISGRRHFIGITIGAYAPFCFVAKGLLESSMTEMNCDNKLKFIIKSIDTSGQVMDTGASIFRVQVDHEILDYDIRLRKLLAHNINAKKKIEEQAVIDDNMDGTYDGFMNLIISGKYRIKITLNDLEIKGSPFEVNCSPGKVLSSNCIAYFGKFADFSTLFNESGSVKLICNCDDGIVFTVSCFDKYGNKCTDILNTSIIVKCENINEEVIGTETYTRGSNGIFPCVLHAPKETGVYKVLVYIDNIDSHKQIRGSPFELTVNPKVDNAVINDESYTNNNETFDNQNDRLNNDENNNQYNEEDQKLITLTKMEMTRKRAIDALRKKMNQLKFEKEMKRKQTVRRVGGGFAIKYSNEI